MQDLATFIQLEIDPIRRQALIELAMAKKNIDVASLPKSEPQPLPQPSQPLQPSKKPELVPTT